MYAVLFAQFTISRDAHRNDFHETTSTSTTRHRLNDISTTVVVCQSQNFQNIKRYFIFTTIKWEETHFEWSSNEIAKRRVCDTKMRVVTISVCWFVVDALKCAFSDSPPTNGRKAIDGETKKTRDEIVAFSRVFDRSLTCTSHQHENRFYFGLR